jgi:pilus assembly protein CpaB
MLYRNILIAVGILCSLGGLALSAVWLSQMRSATDQAAPAPEAVARTAILVTTRYIPTGTLLRPEDVTWKQVEPAEIRAGHLLRGQTSEADILGAVTRRNLAKGEPLTVAELVRANDAQFLAAALRPGMRAISIPVDAPQSASGLVRPGNSVDVILIQSFAESTVERSRKSVGETVLRDVRVIAIDQSLRGDASPDARMPKTVTLEVSERQAQKLLVAANLGRLQLSIRPLEGADSGPGEERRESSTPTWASDVSPALKELMRKNPQAPAPSTIEGSVRRPPSLTQ